MCDDDWGDDGGGCGETKRNRANRPYPWSTEKGKVGAQNPRKEFPLTQQDQQMELLEI